jgi:hypothetical protein
MVSGKSRSSRGLIGLVERGTSSESLSAKSAFLEIRKSVYYSTIKALGKKKPERSVSTSAFIHPSPWTLNSDIRLHSRFNAGPPFSILAHIFFDCGSASSGLIRINSPGY